MDRSTKPRLTVLVSDPDINQQHILNDCLQSRYSVITAQTLAMTKQLLTQYHPSILLLELDQTDGDGMALIKQIIADTSLRNTIIACVTKRSSVQMKVQAFQSGADDYIVKPINPTIFASRLTLLLRLSKLPSWRNPEYH